MAEDQAIEIRAREIFDNRRLENYRQTDRLFAYLLFFEYLAGIGTAIWISPRTWSGTISETHIHVWTAILLGGLAVFLPILLAVSFSGRVVTRHAIAIGQMFFCALLIHLSGGRIETHFYIFGSLAFLAFYRDWKVLITATVVVAVDHFVRAIYWPQSVFGVLTASPWRAAEHAGWVLFEDLFLIRSCLRSVREIRRISEDQAKLESTNERIEKEVQDRTSDLIKSKEELNHREQHIRSILDTAADSIITINEKGTIFSVNLAGEKMFGYQAKELIGNNIKILMPEPYHSEHDGYLENYKRTGVKKIIGFSREVTGLRRDGSTFPLDLSVSEVGNGKFHIFTGIARDISERKQIEQNLKKAKEEAETANRTKSQFLANMSHELRTPMNAIIGYSEMLEEEAEDLGMKDFIPDIQKIHTSGKHLLNLINDILDLSKIEAGKMDVFIEEFDLRNLLQEVELTIKPLVSKNSNVFRILTDDHLGMINSDQTKLRQCLFNLLSNACKFTENGEIQLLATRSRKNDLDWIELKVKDNGIGMSPKHLEKVFEAFTQAEGSTTRKYGGTGLGLTITKEFCKMLGGDLTVESELNKGTEFKIRVLADLNIQQEKVTDQIPSTVISFESEMTKNIKPLNPVVLVVDDDSTVHDLMSRFLEKEGFQVISAYNGEDAINLAKKTKPIAITLDVMMPKMDGWMVLNKLKADPETKDIPVIMSSMLENKELGFSLGASEYMTKPIDRTQLTKLLEKYRCDNPSCKILVVEDDLTTREMIFKSLKKTGCQLIEAENGRAGLDRVSEHVPDLVLLDLMMPIMDGFEFVKEFRKNEANKNIPIVVLTAKDLTHEDYKKLQGGVESIRQKGAFSREELLNEVLHFLKCSVDNSFGESQ